MAQGVATLSTTYFVPTLSQSLHPPSILLHPHGHYSRFITTPKPKRLNVSKREDESGEFDDGFMYGNDLIDGDEDNDEEEEDDDDDTESSINLLFRFLQSMFKKVSNRVRRASRSVLPAVIPPQLVSFGVDGVLLLGSLSILKAFLGVACTIGGSVFVVILLLRVIWAAIYYFQSSRNDFNRTGSSYRRTQPGS